MEALEAEAVREALDQVLQRSGRSALRTIGFSFTARAFRDLLDLHESGIG
jgi:hypothetical protein